MKNLSPWDLKESLTLLILQKVSDHEGGWREDWKKGPPLWGYLWPIFKAGPHETQPHYRLVIRSGINLPKEVGFLWHLRETSKHLRAISQPTPIQFNKFLCMLTREEKNADRS
jgi:hypothetical protein